jgi:hypothetical protein
MKKLFASLSIFFIFLLISSCKKSSSSSTYFLTATINGTSKTFGINPAATIDTSGNQIEIGMVGAVSATTDESINIELNNLDSLNPIVAGVYSDTSSDFEVEGFYDSNPSTQYMAGFIFDGPGYAGSAQLANHFKIVISSIDNVAIKGSFSGNFYPNGDPSQTPIAITNGNFYLKFFH